MAKKTMQAIAKPEKPFRDPLLDDIVLLLKRDRRSRFAKANVSGLSASTFKNWEDGKTRRPQAVSLRMAGQMLGYELNFVKGE